MVQLLMDTDLSCDVDDAVALAVADIWNKKREIDFLAITHCLQHEDCIKIVQRINKYYDTEIPVGLAPSCKLDYESYSQRFLKETAQKSDILPIPYFDSIDLIKKTLERANRGSVTMLCIGLLNNLAALANDPHLKSLMYEKVKEIVIVGGNFRDYGEYFEFGNIRWEGEYNIISDIESARVVFEQTQLPLTLVDFNQGVDVILEIDRAELKNTNILREIFYTAKFLKRPMWDVVALFYAAGREEFTLSECGHVVLDRKGKTSFVCGGGNHRLAYVKDKKRLLSKIYSVLRGS